MTFRMTYNSRAYRPEQNSANGKERCMAPPVWKNTAQVRHSIARLVMTSETFLTNEGSFFIHKV